MARKDRYLVKTASGQQNLPLMELKAPQFHILSFKSPALRKKGNVGRVITYINERLDLSKYGDTVEGITYSPAISEKLPENLRGNENDYIESRKRWFLSIDLDFDKAVQMDDWEYDKYVLEGFLQCLERPGEVKGFDKAAFKRDILEIIEGLMQQAA